MDLADILIFVLLAAADACLMVYLRRRRARCLQLDRMTRSLQLHLRRELTPEAMAASRRQRVRQLVG